MLEIKTSKSAQKLVPSLLQTPDRKAGKCISDVIALATAILAVLIFLVFAATTRFGGGADAATPVQITEAYFGR